MSLFPEVSKDNGLQWLLWIDDEFLRNVFSQTSFSDQIHQTSNGNHFEDEFVLRFLFLSFGPQLSCGCCRVAGKSGTDGLGDECSQCR